VQIFQPFRAAEQALVFAQRRFYFRIAWQVTLVLYPQALRRAQFRLVIVAQPQFADQARRLGGDALALVVAAVIVRAARMAVGPGQQKMS
jgi:hypothetical protein